jgi:AcrR family transcriptional regulator
MRICFDEAVTCHIQIIGWVIAGGIGWHHKRKDKRAQQPSLSREHIVRAAIELADAEGVGALSMRRIAAKLGVGTMSLYWYVSSKQDLFDLALDAVFGEIELPAHPSGDWRADLRMIAMQMRSMLRRHLWLSALLNSRPSLGPNGLRYAEFCLAALDGLGLDSATMISIFETIDGYIVGYVQTKLAEETASQQSGMTEQKWRKALEPYLRQIAATGRYPTFARLALENTALNDEATGFAFGLDCVLDGIAARIARP